MFKLAFKQYKAKSSSPDLTEVINVDDIEARQNDPLQKDNISAIAWPALLDCSMSTGLSAETKYCQLK
ncbi:uncharacterized protein LOC119556552 isoform X4 [Drosophila subpulchrella]|uniref:uncharacterized protein LOC119556552 isoform X4 n=1 Tax=Drosophila subpulchrella TaxID=1486046 RepID=UPI0018A144DA|nr:uncharacterized protein LOC119556552 isoform X4 [Drosophila subpulchrella]